MFKLVSLVDYTQTRYITIDSNHQGVNIGFVVYILVPGNMLQIRNLDTECEANGKQEW